MERLSRSLKNELILDPDELERWREHRRFLLNVVFVPSLRLVGFSLLAVTLYLHNRYILPDVGTDMVWSFALVVWAYSLVSWAFIAAFHRTTPWVSELFLVLDLVPQTASIYLSGVAQSWLAPVVLLRAADQAGTTQRRVLLFGLLSVLTYLAMMCYAWEAGHAVDCGTEVVKAGLFLVAVLFMSLATRSVEQLRARLRSAIRLARTSVLDLQDHLEKRQRMEDELRLLSNRLNSVQEEERKRIARELHDELGQMLTVLKVEAHLLEAKLGPDERLATMSERIEDALKSVRELSTRLRPQILDDLGLSAGIDWLAQDVCGSQQMRHRLVSRLDESVLGPECTTALFRICQEALTNAVRHSGAEEVEICLDRESDGQIVVTISDNGVGIPEEALRPAHSLGLLGIRERARALGGSVQVEARAEGGTRVTVRLSDTSV